MTGRTRLPRGVQRAMAVVAMAAVLLAAMVVIDRDRSEGIGVSALPGATGQPPTGPTGGGSGGGSGGPPFPLEPPGIPSGPSAYNSGSYPAPDQSWGIDIYQTGAQAPSGQGGSNQAPNYPQQQLQPANGTQPPDYDAPLQTQPAQQPSHLPQSSAPTPQPSTAQSPATSAPPTEPDNSSEQDHCASSSTGFAGGGGRGLILARPAPLAPALGPGCVDCPPQAGPQPPPQTPPSKVTAPCEGVFNNTASTMTLQQSPTAGIPWRVDLAPIVSDQGLVNFNVQVFVDGKMANVYQTHIEPWDYIFHGPLPRTFDVKFAPGTYTMHTGSEVSFLYYWQSVTKSAAGGYGFVNCLYTA